MSDADQTELDKAHRLLSQSVGWQRDAEIIKAKQQAEIERLTNEVVGVRLQYERLETHNIKLDREIERLRSEKDHWIIRCEQREAEIERLRALVGEIQESETRHVDETRRLRAERDDYVGRLEVAIEKIVELRAERDDYMRLADSLQAEKSNLKAAENERPR